MARHVGEGYCPVCGTQRSYTLAFTRYGYSILRCAACGVGKTDIPAGVSIEDIYTGDYFSGGRADGYADYVGSEAVLRAEFRHVLDELIGLGHRSGRLLEVGCAFGFFLAEAAAKFVVEGVEVNGEAVAFCRSRGLAVEQGTLTEDYIERRGQFDVVVLLDVVEHLTEPDGTIQLLHRCLRPGGVLLLSTGDWDSRLSRVMGKYWRLMTPPQHAFFFSPRTMSRLLDRIGFGTIRWSYPWKVVPLGLVMYQLGRVLGMTHPPRLERVSFGVSVNLFDAFRMTAVKRNE